MKRNRLTALLCAVFIASTLLAGCAANGPTVATVGGEAITTKDVKLFTNFLLLQQQAGITVDEIDDQDSLNQLYREGLDNTIMYKVLLKKGMERKYYPLDEAKRKEIDDQISQYLESQLEALIEKYTQQAASDPSINADREARKELNASMEKSGLTRQNLTMILRYDTVAGLFYNEIVDTVTVSDEELQAGYDKKVAEQKEQYSADPAAFEEFTQMAQYSGSAVVYKPEGYRYVKHILIAFPEDVANQISEAQSAGDAEAAKKLRQDALPQIQAKADEVLAKVNAGGDFDSLMTEYGEDPGMKQEPASQTGYELGAGTAFVQEFKDAALKLNRVGDVTGLVATDFGYHIIKYVGNVPSGPIPLEDVKDLINDEVLAEKQGEAWKALIDQLKAEYKVQEFPDKLPTLAPAATATAAAEG